MQGMPSSDVWPCAGAEVRSLFSCSRRELALSAFYIASLVALSWATHHYSWLALYCAIVLPIAAASLVLPLFRSILGRHFRWTAVWIVLLAALVGGAELGLLSYQRLMAMFALQGVSDSIVLAAAFGVGALLLGVPLWRAQGQATVRQFAELRQVALVAELKTLQAQVEPHFLYNTLANARYLARRDPDKAVKMLEHLIGYLHGALPDMRANTTTLGREFELADHYLALIAIRFGERLQYRVSCPPELASLPVPPLMLMVLVENAVKHGVEPRPGPVSIDVSARADGDTLLLAVDDDGAGPDNASGGTGVGLANLRARLQSMFDGGAAFTLSRTPAGVTEARLNLPLRCLPAET